MVNSTGINIENLRSILDEQRRRYKQEWEQIWKETEPKLINLRKAILTKNLTVDDIRSWKDELPRSRSIRNIFRYVIPPIREPQTLFENNRLKVMLKEINEINDFEKCSELFIKAVKDNTIPSNVATISTWWAIFKPQMFMPILREWVEGSMENVIISGRLAERINVDREKIGNPEYAVEFIKTVRAVAQEIGIRNMIEVAYYFSKYDPSIKPLISIKDFFNSKGYNFPDHLTAQFYTALKTKGFVILSGLSGTGKTKIALEFVNLLKYRLPEAMGASGKNFNFKEEIKKIRETIEQKGFAVDAWDYVGKIKSLNPPFILWQYNSDPKSEKYQRVVMGVVITDYRETTHDELPENWKERLTWHEDVYGSGFLEGRIEFKKLFIKIEDVWEIDEPISNFIDVEAGKQLFTTDASGMKRGFKIVRCKDYENIVPSKLKNYIFLSVRPDWRDSKPLLGYYNPLDKKYYKTPLLELILRAIKDYKQNKEKAMPYFVILDEMNLAHVEYYFADFLSVLESGRDEDGFTRESIKLHNDNKVEEEQGIPKEIRLPPNIYIIGTVNVDETTYMFSPKVLDRAFTIEFHDVDLSNYLPSEIKPEEGIDFSDLRERIIEDLRNNGKFLTYADKAIIKDALQKLPSQYWEILQKLNKALEPYDLHFGYRVVDEIALFFKNAKESQEKGIISFESEDEIFDSALFMKILPKFHGNRKKLEKPLLIVLKVAKYGDIDDNDIEKSTNDLFEELLGDRKKDISEIIIKELNNLENYRFKHTAKKVLRMLRQLYEVGFTSFS